MKLVSRLFSILGIPQKLGDIIIIFYEIERGSVNVSKYLSKNEIAIVDAFIQFYPKVLFNLSKCGVADTLIAHIKTASQDVLPETGNLTRPNILGSGLALVSDVNDKTWKKCLIKVYRKDRYYIETHFPVGEHIPGARHACNTLYNKQVL